MKIADLHIHSSYSDGSLTPEEIIELSKKQGLKYISITDHDTIASQYITKEKNKDIEIISGVEFSTMYNDLELHILGYKVDVNNNKLNELVNRLSEARLDRCKEIIEKLKRLGVNIQIEEMIGDGKLSLGRGNIAKEIVKKGYSKNFKEAFCKYLMQGKPAYVKGYKEDYKNILSIINASGGIAVLAHPGKIYRSIEVQKIIRELRCYGLKGLEVYHPSHRSEQVNCYYNLAQKYKLLITGGSDFHGKKSEDNTLGIESLSKAMLDKIINYK